MMTLEEFKHLLDVYSADLSRWPEDLLRQALALTEKDPQARAAFDAVLAEDDLLRHADFPVMAPAEIDALAARIMAVAAETPQRDDAQSAGQAAAVLRDDTTAESFDAGVVRRLTARWSAAYLFAPGGGLLAAAVVGFMLGFYPAAANELLIDPVFYNAEQIIGESGNIYEGSIF